MIATHRKFVERTSSPGRVDVQAGVIYSVKLLGRRSKNAREYTEQALRNGANLYRNVKVYMGHPKRDDFNEDRNFADWVGVIQNPRYERGAIYGDIRLRRESSHFNALIEAAEMFAGSFGCSHVAVGRSVERAGVEFVEELGEVHSVDLVMEPATTNGLFESIDASGVLGELGKLLEKITKAHPENEALEDLCRSFLVRVAPMVSLASDAEETEEPNEPGDLGDEMVRESYFKPPRRPPSQQALKRFCDQLRF